MQKPQLISGGKMGQQLAPKKFRETFGKPGALWYGVMQGKIQGSVIM